MRVDRAPDRHGRPSGLGELHAIADPPISFRPLAFVDLRARGELDRVSTLRTATASKAFPNKRGPAGEILCAYCSKQLNDADGKPISDRRRRYCSEACSDEVYIRVRPSFARAMVRQRDKGVCAVCHLDTTKIRAAYMLHLRPYPGWRSASSALRWEIGQALRVALVVAGYLKGSDSHLWEMDHILPVSEGGGLCGLDNLRTVCHRCHGNATRELRGRLGAIARRENAERRRLGTGSGQITLF